MSDEIIYSNIQSKGESCWCCSAGELVGVSIACDQTGYEISEGVIVTFEEYCSYVGGTTTVAADFPC